MWLFFVSRSVFLVEIWRLLNRWECMAENTAKALKQLKVSKGDAKGGKLLFCLVSSLPFFVFPFCCWKLSFQAKPRKRKWKRRLVLVWPTRKMRTLESGIRRYFLIVLSISPLRCFIQTASRVIFPGCC